MTVYSTCVGDNAKLISDVARLYVKDNMTIADVTFGKGAFWRDMDLSKITLLESDLHHSNKKRRLDFRDLDGYKSGSIDVVVLDPPYMHNPGKPIVDKRYANSRTTTGMYHRDILRLYGDGMREAVRVLRPSGQLWVKCKDEIESGRQCWSHIEIYELAKTMALYAKDLFVLVPTSRTTSNRWSRQLHARKTHSYLWVFEKVK